MNLYRSLFTYDETEKSVSKRVSEQEKEIIKILQEIRKFLSLFVDLYWPKIHSEQAMFIALSFKSMRPWDGTYA